MRRRCHQVAGTPPPGCGPRRARARPVRPCPVLAVAQVPGRCVVVTQVKSQSTRTERAQRWCARLAFLAAVAAVAVLLVFAGLRSLGLLATGVIGTAVTLAAAW